MAEYVTVWSLNPGPANSDAEALTVLLQRSCDTSDTLWDRTGNPVLSSEQVIILSV